MASSATSLRAQELVNFQDRLLFLDGSSLQGNLQGFDTRRGVLWQHPEATKVIAFAPKKLHQIVLDRQRGNLVPFQAGCLVRFANDDVLPADLISLDASKVELQTAFAGQVVAPRSAIRSISFIHRGSAVIYEGPNGPDGWRVGPTPEAWKYRDGAFTNAGIGSLGRTIQFPAMSRTEFELNWTGQLNVIVSMFTEAIDRFDFSSTCYMFSIGAGYVNLQRIQGGIGTTHLGQAQVQDLALRNKARLEIRANKAEATLALLVDGVRVHEWKDQAGFVAQGNGLAFYSQRIGPTLRVSQVKVAEWDGRYEELPAAQASLTETLVKLANHDKMTGNLQSIRDGRMLFQTPQASLEIPLQRVTEVLMPGDTGEAAKFGKDQFRLHLAGGGVITLRLEKWDGQIFGNNPNFGRVALRPEWVRNIQFNPDQPPPLDTFSEDGVFVP